MPSNIFLPAEEDTKVVITVQGKDPVTIDIFDLEDLFVSAQAKSDEMGTNWRDEFPALFKKQTQKSINAAQAVLLWDGIKTRIYDLKKSLLNGYENSQEQASPSSPKRKRKRG